MIIIVSISPPADCGAERIPIHQHRRLHRHPPINMGGNTSVCHLTAYMCSKTTLTLRRSNSYSLYNGGLAGSVWGFIISWLCILCMIASMAEMASMAPTAGGQYHWVSEFAPPSIEKQLSYMVGWSSWLGWVSGKPFCLASTYDNV